MIRDTLGNKVSAKEYVKEFFYRTMLDVVKVERLALANKEVYTDLTDRERALIGEQLVRYERRFMKLCGGPRDATEACGCGE